MFYIDHVFFLGLVVLYELILVYCCIFIVESYRQQRMNQLYIAVPKKCSFFSQNIGFTITIFFFLLLSCYCHHPYLN